MKISAEFKLLTGAALFSLIPVGVIIGKDVSVYTLLFGRLFLAAVILFLMEKEKAVLIPLICNNFLKLLGWTMLMFMAMICYFLSVRYASMSVSSALLGTQPVIMLFLGAAMLKEKISKIGVISAFMAFLGILFTLNLNELNNSTYLLGEILAIISAILLSINYLVKKKYLNNIPAERLTFFQSLYQLPLLFPFLFFESGKLTLSAIAAMFILGVFCTVFAYTLIFSGIKTVKAQKIGVLQSIEYVLPAIIGVSFFNESLGITTLIGILLILSACLLVTKAD